MKVCDVVYIAIIWDFENDGRKWVDVKEVRLKDTAIEL